MRTGQNIVITGSTRGIGLGLAREFLKLGNNVMVCGRTQSGVERALSELKIEQEQGRANVAGCPCDVADLGSVQHLWDTAVAELGSVDIWINNAGLANSMVPLDRVPKDQVERVVDTNVIGTINGSQVALLGMQKQGRGEIYNFEGFGSNGATAEGLSVYGATKRAITYFTESLILETRGTPVKVGLLSPGIVVTDMLTGDGQIPPERWQTAKGALEILADKVETVTPWLARQTLLNDHHGARIAWLTRGKAALRFLQASSRRKRNVFGDISVRR